jgi:hypothetical protein
VRYSAGAWELPWLALGMHAVAVQPILLMMHGGPEVARFYMNRTKTLMLLAAIAGPAKH